MRILLLSSAACSAATWASVRTLDPHEVPPQRYGTPTALRAILAARSPRVRFGRFLAWRIGFGRSRLSGADTLSIRSGRSVLADAEAQQKTSAAMASASRGLRKRFGMRRGRTTGCERRGGAALACS